jgi:hypothetical protein
MKLLVAVALLYVTTKYCSGAHIGTDQSGSFVFVSPNQHYAVIITPTVMPGSSAVSLRVVDTRKQSVLLYSHAGGRGIDVLWSPRSDEVAINSYEANSGDFVHIFRTIRQSATRFRKPAYDATEHKLLRKHPEFHELERWSFFAKRWRGKHTLEMIIRGRFYTPRPRHSLETFAFEWTVRFRDRNRFDILEEVPVAY